MLAIFVDSIPEAMKMKQLTLSLILGTAFLSSCGGWSDEQQKVFMEECEKKENRAYCECIMDGMMAEFDSFEEFRENEAAMAEILSSEECLSLDEQ